MTDEFLTYLCKGNYLLAIKHGWYFEDLENLQKAIDKRGRFPKNYFDKPENKCYFAPISPDFKKNDLREIKSDLTFELRKHESVSSDRADQMIRLLHALAILHEPKTNVEPDLTSPNSHIRNACVDLWMLDDGSAEIGTVLLKVGDSLYKMASDLRKGNNFSSINEEYVNNIFVELENLKYLPNYEKAVSSAFNNTLQAIEYLKNLKSKRRKNSSK